MKAPKEIRNWIKRMVSRYGKPNGVLKSYYFDAPEMERKWANSKHDPRHSAKARKD